MKPKTGAERLVEKARANGSSAATAHGAYRFLRAGVRAIESPLDGNRYEPPPDRGGEEKAKYLRAAHEARLCARYVGMSRLPRHLSAEDRAVIAAHPAQGEYPQLLALPIFVRAYYAHAVRECSRFAQFVARADGEKGNITQSAIIAEDAFARADFGRCRRIHRGESCLQPRIRTESYQRGGWTHHDYYADYTYIEPLRRPGGGWVSFYRDSTGTDHRVFCTECFLRIEGGDAQRVDVTSPAPEAPKAHTLRRYYSAPLRALAPVTWEWSREEGAGYYRDPSGEKYHTEQSPTGPAAAYYRAAIAAFRLRRNEKAANKVLAASPRKILVTIEDSVTAGNCPVGTAEFATMLREQYGLSYVIPAALLLRLRGDCCARRAAVAAAMRVV